MDGSLGVGEVKDSEEVEEPACEASTSNRGLASKSMAWRNRPGSGGRRAQRRAPVGKERRATRAAVAEGKGQDQNCTKLIPCRRTQLGQQCLYSITGGINTCTSSYSARARGDRACRALARRRGRRQVYADKTVCLKSQH